jgi:hypothetical protein
MKKIILLLALFLSVSFAKEKNGALGLWVQGGNSGEWWGLDYKHLGPATITDIYFHLSASNDHFAAAVYPAYYWHYSVIKADASVGRFPLYWGPIGGVGYWNNGSGIGDENGLALRFGVTGGISWILPLSFPMDISLELNPVAEVHFVSWKDDRANKKSETRWDIPSLYFRLLFHFYLF